MFGRGSVAHACAVVAGCLALAALGAPNAAYAASPRSRIVLAGSARFEVLTPTLIRLEYAADGVFENRPTLTAVNRAEPVPAFIVSQSLGALQIETSALTLRYVENSGPFTPANTSVTLHVGGVDATVRPAWNPCADSATLCGPSNGTPGTEVDGSGALSGALATPPPCAAVSGIPEIGGTLGGYLADVPAECANVDGGYTSLAGNEQGLESELGTNNQQRDLSTDGLAIGGYTREVQDVQDQRAPLHAGLLRTSGWYLLDDTSTAILTSPTTAVARPSHIGPYQDGYFFAYGHDYDLALRDFAQLSGPAPLLPEWTFGPWFSEYYPYSASDYKDDLIPAFRDHDTPVDGLSIDTDWKGGDDWNGWEWNSTLFPDPTAFLSWAAGQGLHVVLNIHPSIDSTDPRFPEAQQIAGGKLTAPTGGCEFYRQSPTCYVFDWGDPNQAKAYFWLQEPFLQQGVSAFWLDWCCDASTVSTLGLTPDSWINQLYAQDMIASGRRGFVLSRIGSGIYDENSYTGDIDVPATGAWSDHRNAIAFTGDADSDFTTLAFEVKLTPAEGAAIGEPYISNDIGGYTGDELPDDLYVRWIQMGTFSPIMRLHSDHGNRLPWEYDAAAEVAAERFMRLRESLVPYLYETAEEAHGEGLPMAREVELDWPDQPDALKATDEWMLGDSLLVAPIYTPGTTATRSVWLPPGEWTDFFTGQTITGPRTVNVTDGFDTAPVWVRAGGIVTLAPPMEHLGARPVDPLNIRVAPGSPGTASLYEDAGDGLGYEHGQSRTTHLRYSEASGGWRKLVIDPAQGSYPGAPAQRSYAVQFLAAGQRPTSVTVDGRAVPESRVAIPTDPTETVGAVPASDGWTWSASTHIVTVLVTQTAVRATTTVAIRED